MSVTPNLSLSKPDDGDTSWGDDYREAMDTIDSLFHSATGHDHDGTAGGGPNVPAANVSGLAAAVDARIAAADLADLADVGGGAASDGQVLTWVGAATAWQPATMDLGDLGDVDLDPAPSDGDVLTYVAASSAWEPVAPSGGAGATELDDLTDVDAASPSDGEVLTYVASASAWEPLAPGEPPSTSPPLDPIGINLVKRGAVLEASRGVSAWDAEDFVESPAIWWDEGRQLWGMAYVAYDGTTTAIGLAWSADLLNWEQDEANPILEASGTDGAFDEGGVTGPLVWVEGGTYYLYYIGNTMAGVEGGVKSLGLATGPDLYTLTCQGQAIAPSGFGWREKDVFHASIIKVRGTYYLFFNAADEDDVETIGYATASAAGGPWTVDDANSPVLDVGTTGQWDDQIVGDPAVWHANGTYYMAYWGYDGSIGQEGLAWTTEASFPLGWTKHENNPILAVGDTGAIDEDFAHKPYIVRTPGTHYHYYTAGVGTGGAAVRRIALATETVPHADAAGHRDFPEVAAPAAPAAGQVRLYAKSDGKLYSKDDNGTETLVSGGLGGGSGGVTILDTQTAGASGAASFDFPTLPSDGEILLVVVVGRGTNASESVDCNLRLNNDSGSNYHSQYAGAFNGPTAGNGEFVGTAQIFCGSLPGANAPSGSAGVVRVTLPAYRQTTFHKPVIGEDFNRYNASQSFVATVGGVWASTSAVTRITLLPSAGSFAEGSVAYLLQLA